MSLRLVKGNPRLGLTGAYKYKTRRTWWGPVPRKRGQSWQGRGQIG